MLVLEAAVDAMRASTQQQVSFISVFLDSFTSSDQHIFLLLSNNHGLDASVTIGSDSCLGFSACEELSGNVTVGDDSCYGLKACSNSSHSSTIKIDNQSCIGARSCMSMSGNSSVSNSSCVDPQACKSMNDGEPLAVSYTQSFFDDILNSSPFIPSGLPDDDDSYRIYRVS